jgi:fructose-1,6-bisphosphatase I
MTTANDGTAAEATIDAVVDTIAETTGEVRTAIAEERQYLDQDNTTGDRQLAADIRADELFEARLLDIDAVGSYASEERDSVVEGSGDRHVAMDPLDGSSNLKPNGGMGTIFGVYDSKPPTRGQSLLAAGFVIYGPITSMVVARGDTVREYLMHEGERRCVDEDLTLPDEPTVYGFGGGADQWTEPFTQFANAVTDDLKLRYSGAMIADVSQVLCYGGIFSYPALQDRPDGKLRLQFEGQPMAYVVEAAGGASTNGTTSLLDIEPTGLHERTPLHLGNRSLIEELEATHAP